MSLRPYQAPASAFLAAHPAKGDRALVVCPAGGGKTIIGASALASAAAEWDRIGWACNTREQVEQGQAALDRCGVRPAWVRCVAGLGREDVENLDFLVIDECHHLPAASWSEVAYWCLGAIWGLTATPKSGDPDRDFAFGQFWRGCVHTVARAEVMAGGHLAKGVVKVIDLDTPGEFDAMLRQAAELEALKMGRRYPVLARTPGGREELMSRALWRATLDLLINHPARNAATVEIARREIAAGHSVLVLVAEIEHGQRLADEIGGAVVAHSKMGVRKRREAIAAFRDGSLKCLVATSLADEGLDVPRASVLILACPGRSGAKLEQRTGRVMRPHEGKACGIVYDFADTGASMAKSQHRARLGIYRRLGYAVEATNHLPLVAA